MPYYKVISEVHALQSTENRQKQHNKKERERERCRNSPEVPETIKQAQNKP